MQEDINNIDLETPEPPIKLKPKRWARIHRILRDKKGVRYFIIAVGLIFVTGIGLLAWIAMQPEPKAPATYAVTKPKPKEIPKFYSPLTGVEVIDEAATKRQVTAVMIENSPDARPQSGLKDAGVVYEAVAEGGITRFLALYQEARPGLIGPVRSVRPYYVEWAAAYDAAVAHIGGSARALTMIRSGDYGVDLDQFFNAGTYWRATDRYAPHNVYTTFDKLDALTSSKGKTTSTFTAFPRKNEMKSTIVNASNIDINVSTGYYAVNYIYDATTNSYVRSEGGQKQLDREGGQIQPKVVIAMKVQMTLGFEDGYREQITTTGSGEANIFQDGIVTPVTWSKPDVKSQITFTGADGKPVALDRGQTWITALDNTKSVTWQ